MRIAKHSVFLLLLLYVGFGFESVGQAFQFSRLPSVPGSRPTNGQLESAYLRAVEAIAGQQWETAVAELQEIIDGTEDAYPIDSPVPQPGAPELSVQQRQQSWKALAAQAMTDLPEAGKQAYVDRFEATTAAAIAAANLDSIDRARIALKRRWTPAGRAELLRLASRSIDSNRGAEAVQMLSAIPDTEAGIDALVESRIQLARSMSAGPVVASKWLRPGGTAAGYASVTGAPLSSDGAWSVPLVEDYDAGDAVESFEQALTAAVDGLATVSRSSIPYRYAIEPLLVGDHVVFSGLGRLRAYDVKTGKLAWRSALPDKTLTYLTRRVLGRSDVTSAKRQMWMLERIARDRAQGTISSDGTTVFAIIDAGSDIWTDYDSPEAYRQSAGATVPQSARCDRCRDGSHQMVDRRTDGRCRADSSCRRLFNGSAGVC